MPNTPIYYNIASVVIPVPATFTGSTGVITDPASVICIVTDPDDNSVTYTYSGAEPGTINEVVRNGTGKYAIDLQPYDADPVPPAGLWHTTWVGTGGSVANGVQVLNFSFRVLGQNTLAGQNRWYIGLEELKSRLGLLASSTADDYEMSMAIQAATAWINRYCGTHFYPVTEARTYPISNIYYLPIDQIVPGSITDFAVDYDGDGIFETTWTEGNNFQVYREGDTYNENYAGVKRPFDLVKVILGGPTTVAGGEFFPFVWPFTPDDRVKITGTWGWQEIPPEVHHACMLLATNLFKEKDSPWGVVGMGDLGMVRTQQSPWIVDMLRPYRNMRKTLGV